MNKKVERLIKEPYSSQIVCNNKWWLENGNGTGLPIEDVLRNEAEHIDKCLLYTFAFRKAPQAHVFGGIYTTACKEGSDIPFHAKPKRYNYV